MYVTIINKTKATTDLKEQGGVHGRVHGNEKEREKSCNYNLKNKNNKKSIEIVREKKITFFAVKSDRRKDFCVLNFKFLMSHLTKPSY